MKLWGEVEGRLEAKHTYTGHTLGVVSVVVGGGGRHAASSALDSVIRVWSLADNSELAIIETEPSETWALAFAPGEEQVVIAAAGVRPPARPRPRLPHPPTPGGNLVASVRWTGAPASSRADARTVHRSCADHSVPRAGKQEVPCQLWHDA